MGMRDTVDSGPSSTSATRQADSGPENHFSRTIPGNRVEPLIEAQSAFVALERACLQARQAIHLCFRIIDPRFPLFSEEARKAGYECWQGLLSDQARNGRTVRVLTADFDPVMATGMHRDARARYEGFREAERRLDEADRPRFQVMCVQHPALVGRGAAVAAWPATWKRLGEQTDLLNRTLASDGKQAAEALLDRLSALKRHIAFDRRRGRFVRRLRSPHRIRPATHHEKLAIIDGEICFVGGIDVCEDTYDTARHEEDRAWHDVGYRIEGPIARQAEEYFRQRWTEAASDYVDASPDMDISFPEQAPDPASDETAAHDPETGIKLLRTRSVARKGLFVRTPQPVVTEIREALTGLVNEAERFLYIENQFLRDLSFADAIAARGQAKPDLFVIAMLPVVPFRSMEKGRIDRAAAHGLALQEEALKRIGRAFGDRLAVYTLVHDEPDHEDGSLEKLNNGKLIYIHSKLLIADDRRAVAGSANFNGRSFGCDSELSFEWRDPEAIRAFRQRLWMQFLGNPEDGRNWEPGEFMDRWSQIAQQNASCAPEERQGFAVPYATHPKARGVRRHWLIPDDLL